jgi:hypothetical protein
MKILLLAGATLALVAAVNPLACHGARAEALDRYLPACRHRLRKCRHDNRALRVPVRIRQARSMAGPLGPGPLADS